ncbi:golgin-45 isoform X1 [Hydra vulgaris]|uniref:golgin-45 isoform X1 n=1 Tax=Hydra vulgaris TaxID=6087 RepID=UPI001F5FB954|nr:golgin-45 [Hydra vulgaris]
MEPSILKISRFALNLNQDEITKERFPGDGMESVASKNVLPKDEFSNIEKIKLFKSPPNFQLNQQEQAIRPHNPDEDLIKYLSSTRPHIPDQELLESLQSKVKFLQEYNEKLIDEKLKVSHQLATQTQINNELKNLLVASIGDDLETRYEKMILNQIQSDLELKRLINLVEEYQEEKQQAYIQVDVWRSKFLASRVMNEELTQWKSALYYKYRDSHTALQSLLEEHSKIRVLNDATRIGLIKIAELLNSKDASLDSEMRLTLVDTAFINHDLVESLIEIIEESSWAEKPNEIKQNIFFKQFKNHLKEIYVLPSELSTAEQLAHEIVTNTGIQTEELVRMRRDYLAHNRISHFLSTNYHVTYNCCNSCKGRIIHL